jgi:hypothetical protein
LDEYFLALWLEEAPRQELIELLELLDQQSTTRSQPSALAPGVPLVVHARYTRTDVLAALGLGDGIKPPPSREGLTSTPDGRYDAPIGRGTFRRGELRQESQPPARH